MSTKQFIEQAYVWTIKAAGRDREIRIYTPIKQAFPHQSPKMEEMREAVLSYCQKKDILVQEATAHKAESILITWPEDVHDGLIVYSEDNAYGLKNYGDIYVCGWIAHRTKKCTV